MTINEFLDIALDGVNNIFDPAVNYKGGYQFNYKALREASKISEDGRNYIEGYFDKYYFEKVHQIFPNFLEIPLIFSNTYKEDGYGRCLRVSTNDVVASLFFSVTGIFPSISDERTEEENRITVRDTIRDYLKKSRDCISKGKDSEYYDLLYNNYLKFNESGMYNMTFDQYLAKMTNVICDGLLANLRKFYSTFDKDIDIHKIATMVDLEKFNFIMSHQLLMMSQAADELLNIYHNSLTNVYRYIEAVDLYIKEIDPGYRISLTSYDVVGNAIPNYNYHKLKKDFNKLVTKYPQFQLINLDTQSINFDPRDVEAIESYKAMMAKMLDDKVLSTSWEIIPSGHDNSNNNPSGTKSDKKPLSPESLEIRLSKGQQRLVNCKMFLDGTKYYKTVRGINNFDGYIGYIYDNGIVVFEKFYKDYETRTPVDEGATYVMTFENFVEMSQKTKTEIMEYIKTSGDGVRRIYHSSEWQEKVSAVITTGALSTLDNWKENKKLKKTNNKKK